MKKRQRPGLEFVAPCGHANSAGKEADKNLRPAALGRRRQ